MKISILENTVCKNYLPKYISNNTKWFICKYDSGETFAKEIMLNKLCSKKISKYILSKAF